MVCNVVAGRGNGAENPFDADPPRAVFSPGPVAVDLGLAGGFSAQHLPADVVHVGEVHLVRLKLVACTAADAIGVTHDHAARAKMAIVHGSGSRGYGPTGIVKPLKRNRPAVFSDRLGAVEGVGFVVDVAINNGSVGADGKVVSEHMPHFMGGDVDQPEMPDFVAVFDGFILGQEKIPDDWLKVGFPLVPLKSGCARLTRFCPVLNDDRQIIRFKLNEPAITVVLLVPERDRIEVVATRTWRPVRLPPGRSKVRLLRIAN